jgi:hypothetical protein
MQRYAAGYLRFLELYDPGLGDTEPAGELSGGHAERVPDGTQPAFGRTGTFGERAQRSETLVEMADGILHPIRYSL